MQSMKNIGMIIFSLGIVIICFIGLNYVVSIINEGDFDNEIICHDAWKGGYVDGIYGRPPDDNVDPKFQICYNDGYAEGLENPLEDYNISQNDNTGGQN